MEHILKAWLVDNSITTDNKEDKILLPETVDNVTLSNIYRLMRAEDTGSREETIRHVTDLFQRVVERFSTKRISSQHRPFLRCSST